MSISVMEEETALHSLNMTTIEMLKKLMIGKSLSYL